ncbi:MAG: hypothetical protein AB7O37_00135 [Vicinamibacteria bacterium]
MRARATLALSLVVVVAAGAAAALGPLAPSLTIDREGDWRRACLGCRRDGGTDTALAVARRALVHVHGLDGRAGGVDLLLSARAEAVEVEVAAGPDEPPLVTGRLGSSPERIRLPLAPGQGDLDLWLRFGGERGVPGLLHRAVIERRASAADRVLQWLPLVAGLATLLLVRGRGLGLALTFALAALAVALLALVVLRDPAALLELPPAARERLQAWLVAAVAAAALVRVPDRRLAWAAIALVAWLAYLPSVNDALVSDDFLWVRPWTLAEVGSTFVGSEDPSGVSNVYYRPLASTVHAVEYFVWGDFVPGVHLTNLLLAVLSGGAAMAFLGQLGLSPRASLLGALVWTIHPMSASAAAWISQRTDLVATLFYLSSLALLLSPLGRRGWPPLVPALFALATKELSISLVAVAALAVFLALPTAERRARLRALGALGLLSAAYLGWWIRLFPLKAAERLFGEGGAPAADRLDAIVSGLASILGSLVWPVGYERWWRERLDAWSLPVLVACLAAAPLLALLLGRCPSCRERTAFAAAALAVAWPILVALPLFGIDLVDVYRLGRFPSFGFALVVAAVAHHLEHSRPRFVAALGLAVSLWLAPLALEAARAWGPGGFYYEMSLSLTRKAPDWVPNFAPRPRERFEHQWAAREHQLAAERWVAAR